MSIPLSGLLFVPLALAVFFGAPRRLGQLAIVSAVFSAAAVVKFGSAIFPVGLSPFFFTALLVAIRSIPQWLNRGLHLSLSRSLRRHLRIMVAFIGLAILSAFLFPPLFAGLPIDLARAGPDETYYARMPLHWSLSNAGQAGYLFLDFVVILYLLERVRSQSDLGRLGNALSWSGFLAVLVGIYQWLSHRTGLPFPMELFNSNPAWAQLVNQNMDGFFRISATFAESSGAGAFFAAWVSFEFVLGASSRPDSLRHLIFALIGILMVVATTSTTGYVTTAIMLAVILWRYGVSSRRGGVNPVPVLAGLALAAVAASCALILTGQGSALIAGVVLDKARSGSSLHRTATIIRSLDVFTATYGLGAGLGSNRAMSLLAYIASNLGIAGVSLFAWLLASLASMNRAAQRTGSDLPSALHQALGMAFVARLLALAESGAEISDPILWLLWALVLAAIRQRSRGATTSRGITRTPDFRHECTLPLARRLAWSLMHH